MAVIIGAAGAEKIQYQTEEVRMKVNKPGARAPLRPLRLAALTLALLSAGALTVATAGNALPTSAATVAQAEGEEVGTAVQPADQAATQIATLQKQLSEQQELLRSLQERMTHTGVATTAETPVAVSVPPAAATVVPVASSAVAAPPASALATVSPAVVPTEAPALAAAPKAQSVAPDAAPVAEQLGNPQTTAQRQAYASGVSVWREIQSSMTAQRSMGIELDPAWVMQGLQDMAERKPLRMSRESVDTIMVTLNELYLEKAGEERKRQQTEGRAFQSAFMKEKGAARDAGSLYRIVSAGKGKRITASDVVTVTVTGTLPDGTVFDASGQNGQTKTAKVGALMPAVAIGLQKISRGGHIKVVVPPEKGYGDAGLPPTIPGGATLIFDIAVADAG
ncbi:FKBP-type peptidyl-prolyl cis-trans isomerase [Serratia sp. BIGb0163]|uniref:FKBP-type peptidyl-prolyl cis-trans isomerase n=1 Tax=Serratia sp. BIGb0163 TaxID=2940613 RepID=UPI002167E759|nr:FKBP-type peptidyl-prolyl cis-trans isomerase [Serratia sp. BIGb0163]MCS4269528.1 FKBP-type peptidyl-prolyl cis-trans isomerase [Serratia sp. BIGb0163]